MFLPSLLTEDVQLPGSGDIDFTCTLGQIGLTQRFPLTLSQACAAGRALPLELLPMPYRLPGEHYRVPCVTKLLEKNKDTVEECDYLSGCFYTPFCRVMFPFAKLRSLTSMRKVSTTDRGSATAVTRC